MKAFAGAIAMALASASPTPAPPPDPAALAAVKQYVDALSHGDYNAAYGLLTQAQQRYFGNSRNFASNAQSTHYTIHKYAIVEVLSHGQIIEVIARQDASFLDAANGRMEDGTVKEPYFALRENGAWRVKELYQPWQ